MPPALGDVLGGIEEKIVSALAKAAVTNEIAAQL
jgi:hypothetical protein